MTDHDYLYDGRGAVDSEIARLETLLRRHAFRAPAPPLRARTPRRRMRVIAAVAATLLIGVGGVFAWSQHRLHWPQDRAWSIAARDGDVRIDDQPIAADTVFAPGTELRTGNDGSVRVDVARIGQLALAPDSHVRLEATRSGHHRLRWLGGRVWARVWAPPGQFGIGIDGFQATDLGCEFVIDGAAGGDARLTVHSGWVQIDAGAHEVLVPEGATVALPHDGAPGTPHANDATPAFVAALRDIDGRRGDVSPDDAALHVLLADARPQDAISLVSLLQRDPSLAGGVLFDGTRALLPDADAVSREAVLARRPGALEPWWQALPYPRMKRWWLHWRDALPSAEVGGAAPVPVADAPSA